ncbi:MAG: DUF262 domain-containing protein [Terriglobia bacterium]|jgi:hypothetical protein
MNFYGVTIKATPWRVRDLAQTKKDAKLHLPDLQRSFVWSPERVRALHDSMYRRYPVGALLLWKPSWEGPVSPFITRPWDICRPNPTTERGEPETQADVQSGSIFVLDGQQRLTSLFRVIFQSRLKGKTTPDPEMLVALSPDAKWTENPFHLKSRNLHRQLRDGLLVPAEVLFAGVRGENESLAVQKAIGAWVKTDDQIFYQALDRANVIRNAILGAEIVAYEIDADAEDENVIEIFARLNQQGVRLRPGDLAAARLTGRMKDFRDRARLFLSDSGLKNYSAMEGEEDRPRSGAFVDTDLLVRTALYLGTGLLRYRDIEKRKKGSAEDDSYTKVDAVWDATCAGLKASVDIFRNAGVPDGAWLPYRYLLLPPAVSHAKGNDTSPDQWLAWAIAASLWGHYAGSSDTTAQSDAKAAEEGQIARLFDNVKAQAKRTESLIPDEGDLEADVVLEAGVLLALLIHFRRNNTRSFPSGKLIGFDSADPIEVHHIFPRALLNRATAVQDSSNIPDRLGNLTLIFRTDNEHIKDRAPDQYLSECNPDDLRAHGIPLEKRLWDTVAYNEFCERREKALTVTVRNLLISLGVPPGKQEAQLPLSDTIT